MDLMALEEEAAPEIGQEVEFRPLTISEKAGKVVPASVEILHLVYFKDGQVRGQIPSAFLGKPGCPVAELPQGFSPPPRCDGISSPKEERNTRS